MRYVGQRLWYLCSWRVVGIVATTHLVDALCGAETLVSLSLTSPRCPGYHSLGGCVMLGRHSCVLVLSESQVRATVYATLLRTRHGVE